MIQSETDLPDIDAEVLRGHPLFRGLDSPTLTLLAEQLTEEHVAPGQPLITEGDVADTMFAILTGEIEVLAHGKHGRVCVALLGPGDWVGDMALLETQPRSATARALSPSRLLRMTHRDVRRLLADRDMRQYAVLVENIARELSRRLRVADRLIANSGATLAQRYVTESMRPPPPTGRREP